MIQEIQIRTNKKNELFDITEIVDKNVKDIKDGTITIFIPHTTAGVMINENYDPNVKEDILKSLAKLVPEKDGYRHSESNSDAHIKAALVGNSLTLIVKDGQFLLGQWQGIFFAEFDGPRNRNIIIQTSEN